jgi:ribosomal protein S18 acetylase RimI-like enzyme
MRGRTVRGGGTVNTYTLINTPPSVEAYMHLRGAAGLSPKSLQAATLGLAGTWYGVHIRDATDTIAMGRIIGDGGCFFQVVDIAVLPAYQGQGLGTQIMAALMDHLQSVAPPTALVSLLADGEAPRLYQKFGFTLSAPASVGMIRRL